MAVIPEVMDSTETNSSGQTLVRTSFKRRRRTAHLHVALILASIALCAPVVYAMVVSTQTNAEMAQGQFWFGGEFLKHLDAVWNDRNLSLFMVNSGIMAVVIAVGKTITGLLCGLAFTYFRFPGRWVVFFFVLITLMMPTEISILALLDITIDLGMNNSLAGLTIPFLASATAAFLFRQHFANLPSNLSEAAQLDGASPFQFLTRVLVPVSWNVVGALVVIEFLYGWNMYLWPLLAAPDAPVVQIGLASLKGAGSQGGETTSYGPLMLGALIASIPPVLVFLLLQKPFMKGFAMARDK